MNNNIRLIEIKDILDNQRIYNQNTILEKLILNGFKITQATLSRDLKKLKVGKETDSEGNTYYVTNKPFEKFNQNVMEPDRSILSIEFSGNTGIIKTPPGYASMVASVIDQLNLFELLGTIAGDDAILIIVKEGINKVAFIDTIYEKLNVKNKK